MLQVQSGGLQEYLAEGTLSFFGGLRIAAFVRGLMLFHSQVTPLCRWERLTHISDDQYGLPYVHGNDRAGIACFCVNIGILQDTVPGNSFYRKRLSERGGADRPPVPLLLQRSASGGGTAFPLCELPCVLCRTGRQSSHREMRKRSTEFTDCKIRLI